MTLAPVKPATNRDAKGHFLPGNRANPNGRPAAAFSLTELLRGEIAKKPSLIISRLIELCQSENEDIALKAVIATVRIIEPQAANNLKAGASLELDNGDGRKVRFSLVLGTSDTGDDDSD